MSENNRDEADWAAAAEQSSEVDEAQSGNIAQHDEASDEPSEVRALHVIDEPESDDGGIDGDDVETNVTVALDAVEEANDPEADVTVDDALDLESTGEADAAVEAVDDEEGVQATLESERDPEVESFEAAFEGELESEISEQGVDDDQPVDPYEEFRAELRAKPGKWYVIHSYAGFEKRVKQNIENRKVSLEAEDYIFQVEVPMEDVVEIKNGQRKMVNRVRIPGYVLVRMDLNEDSWSVVRHTPGVTGFVGNAHNPTPLRFEEAFSMLKSLVEIADVPVSKSGGAKGSKLQSRTIPAEVDFEIGETITIKEGSFAGLPGSISEIKPESGKLTVLVSLFERETPVELRFDQVTKL